MSASFPTPCAQPVQQIEAIRLIIEHFSDSPSESTGCVSETRNELTLLLKVLGDIEAQLSKCQDHGSSKLASKLEECHSCLLGLKKLQESGEEYASQGPLIEIQGQLSELIFEFSVINADLAISYHAEIDRLLQKYIEERIDEKRADGVISPELNGETNLVDVHGRWQVLQSELQEFGITTQQSAQERDYITKAIQKAVDEKKNPAASFPPPSVEPLSSSSSLAQRNTDQAHGASFQSLPEGISENNSTPGEITNITPSATEPFTRGKRPSLFKRMTFKMAGDQDELFSLVKTGDLEPIKKALSKGANVNKKDLDGLTALAIASSCGYQQVVSMLLEHKAKTEIKGKNSETALFLAAQKDHEGIVKLLLLNGANPDGPNVQGKTALSQAVTNGNLSIARLLLEKGATPGILCANGDTAITSAVVNDHIEITQLLLNHGVPADQIGLSTRTPLFKAVMNGNVRMVRLLMDHGANPNFLDKKGWSAIRVAVETGKDDIVEIFHQYGHVYEPQRLGIVRMAGAEGAVSLLTGIGQMI
ncbi:hypothetical protein N7466_009775 [Penicillium verhagenii]|uniref:uncharacterized protein n=1 Tax=Penicillium verhagenii TaxID=1562060 RepID=UPI0025459D16|nr:uncharacterized protein N7466_009775 [Penicillium verhagenii]KAJ5921449.1 hypothetical protein N7466_009775 [Penicillium verhagenii]